MTKEQFIEKCEEFLDQSGMSGGSWNSYMSIGDRSDVNTSLYIDSDGILWISNEDSVKRIKTSINVGNVTEFRYSQFGEDGGRFFIICSDYSGLDFCEGEVGFFENGNFGHFQPAIEWFETHPVQ